MQFFSTKSRAEKKVQRILDIVWEDKLLKIVSPQNLSAASWSKHKPKQKLLLILYEL
jgi:hypothetical protein